MVEHRMGLFAEGFDLIKRGKKEIEIRLNDEKRQKINVGDFIVFYRLPDNADMINVEVTGVHIYPDFKSLYEQTDFVRLGRGDKTMDWMITASYEYYKREDELKYGVVAIEFKVVT